MGVGGQRIGSCLDGARFAGGQGGCGGGTAASCCGGTLVTEGTIEAGGQNSDLSVLAYDASVSSFRPFAPSMYAAEDGVATLAGWDADNAGCNPSVDGAQVFELKTLSAAPVDPDGASFTVPWIDQTSFPWPRMQGATAPYLAQVMRFPATDPQSLAPFGAANGGGTVLFWARPTSAGGGGSGTFSNYGRLYLHFESVAFGFHSMNLMDPGAAATRTRMQVSFVDNLGNQTTQIWTETGRNQADGEWHLWAMRYDASNYLNDPILWTGNLTNGTGMINRTVANSARGPAGTTYEDTIPAASATSAPLNIGNDSGLTRPFDGLLGGYRVLNYWMTDAAVRQLYNRLTAAYAGL